MHRIQFIELHDQAWFPSSLRNQITDALQFGFNLLNVYEPILPRLRSILDSAGSRSIIDMGSGAGGPWLDLSRKLQSLTIRSQNPSANSPPLQICLTDKYPNLAAFQKMSAASENRITFYPGSVDATKVPGELKGLRTMFTSFHHFPPEQAQAILQNAVDAGENIGIFEATRRAPSTMVLMFAWVFMLFVGTPWMRPFRWSRLLWTYVVPILPIVLLFDGVVSCLRTYRPQELREMVAKLNTNDYQWETGEHARSFSDAPITYLIGGRPAWSEIQ